MAITPYDEIEEEQEVPESAVRGVYDIVEGNLSTKEDLAEALSF